MKIKRIVFAGILLTILAAGLGYRSTAAQESTPSTFGVETRSFDEQVMDFAEDANTYWLRYNGLVWSDIETTQGEPLDWSAAAQLEQDLADASSRGMEVILIVRGTPAWARLWPNYLCSPMTAAYFNEFASFMEQVVEHFSVAPYNVKYYELWNEPDEYREAIGLAHGLDPDYNVMGCWGNPSNDYFGGGHYGKMLKQAYPAIKNKAAELGVSAYVVLGGLLLPCDQAGSSMIDWSSGVSYNYFKVSKFFEGILVEGGGPYFDYVNFHSYTIYDTSFDTGILMERNEGFWKSSGGQVIGKLTYLKNLMSTYGISDKPILMTEAALATPEGFTDMNLYEASKADYLVWVFVRNLYRGISGTTWYHIDDYGWRDSGLLDRNNRPLPAYRAYKVMTETLTGAGFPERLDGLGSGILGYEFEKGSHTIWVLFSEDGTLKNINKTAFGTIGHIYNLLGGPVTQNETKIYFNRPIYIDNIGNYAPYFSSTPLEEIDQEQNYFYYIETASTGDENFDIHTITLTSPLPGWLTFTDNGDGTATLTGTPRNGDVGSYTIELLVTDSLSNTATQSFTITVHNVNDAPYFTSTPVKQAVMNEEYIYNITTTDPDLIHDPLETLTITAEVKPVWLTFTANGDGTAILTGEPTEAHLGNHKVTLKVTDRAGLFTTQPFTITVVETGTFYHYLPLVVQ